jgi:thymidylate kinase
MLGKYIEFVGVAGAGKTSIQKILLMEALEHKVSIQAREKIGRNISIWPRIISDIFFVIAVIPNIVSLYFLRPRDDFKNTPYIKTTIRNLVKRILIDTIVVRMLLGWKTDYLVNDEGLFGKLVSLCVLTNMSFIDIKRLQEKLLPKPALLIFVVVPPSIASDRESKRDVELPFFNEMASDLKKKFFGDAITMYAKLYDMVQTLPNIEVVAIDNSGDYDDVVNQTKLIVTKLREKVTK